MTRKDPQRVEALESLARSEDAVFAMDRTDRIILWNRAAEEMFGYAAEEVLGKACYDVMGGHDSHQNLYCYPNCPVMYQIRQNGGKVRDFPMCARTAAGARKNASVSTITIPGPYPLPPTIAHVMQAYPGVGGSGNQSDSRRSLLTRRERDVLQCLAQGMSNRRIARKLSISQTTVRNHIQSLLQKMGVHTKFAAVARAFQEGLID